MATNEHIQAVTEAQRIEALGTLLQEMSNDMGSVASIIDNAIGNGACGDDFGTAAALEAAAKLAAHTAALADRLSIACDVAAPIRRDMLAWTLGPVLAKKVSVVEACKAG